MPTTLHFAALSGKSLAKAIAALEPVAGLALSSTEGDDFAYTAAALADGTALTLTRTDDFDTIATWVDGAPTGVNWQFIVQNEAGLDTVLVDRLCRALDQALGVKVSVYQMR